MTKQGRGLDAWTLFSLDHYANNNWPFYFIPLEAVNKKDIRSSEMFIPQRRVVLYSVIQNVLCFLAYIIALLMSQNVSYFTRHTETRQRRHLP